MVNEIEIDDVVGLTEDLDIDLPKESSDYRLKKGDQGTVLSISNSGKTCEVDFYPNAHVYTVATDKLVKLKEFYVTIKASIIKTEGVFAENIDEAEEIAHQQFSVLYDETDENYEQETVNSQEAEA